MAQELTSPPETDDKQNSDSDAAKDITIDMDDETGQTTPDSAEAQPATDETESPPVAKEHNKHFWQKLCHWHPTKKQAAIAGSVFGVLIILAIIPATRNVVLGTVLKTNATLEVYDEFKDEDTGTTDHVQLTGLSVAVDGKEVVKDGTSPIRLSHLKPGKRTLTISKTNYKTATVSLTANLAFGSQHNNVLQKMTATGRQVKVLVANFVTDEPVEGVTVSYKSSSAKTAKDGQAIITVPIESKNSYDLKLHKDGFNDGSQTITVAAKPTIKAQTVHLTPAGKVYFLSRASGKIDVVKSNLDGSDRQTVLAGTGREDDATTTMISTTDWRYLALSTHREDKKSQIIIIDTSNDGTTTADEGNATFTLYGWDGKKLVYTSENQDTPAWKTGRNRLKSYDAASNKLSVLYQTVATGTSDTNYQAESISQVSLVDHRVIYQIVNYTLGTTSHVYSTSIPTGTQKALFAYKANELSLSVTYTAVDAAYLTGYSYVNNKYTYYVVGSDNSWKTIDNLPDDTSQYTYFVSPDGQHLLWSEERDGKQTVFLGDSQAKNEQKLYSASDLKPYAWLTDKYALYSQKDSELYIAPLTANSTPKKISDYHRPRGVSFRGYGGGGGGPY